MAQAHVAVFAREILDRNPVGQQYDEGRYAIRLASGDSVVVTLHVESPNDIDRLRDWLDSIVFENSMPEVQS